MGWISDQNSDSAGAIGRLHRVQSEKNMVPQMLRTLGLLIGDRFPIGLITFQ